MTYYSTSRVFLQTPSMPPVPLLDPLIMIEGELIPLLDALKTNVQLGLRR